MELSWKTEKKSTIQYAMSIATGGCELIRRRQKMPIEATANYKPKGIDCRDLNFRFGK